MNYEMYLFSCLLKLYDLEYNKLPYDVQFDTLPPLYEEFRQSIFNDPMDSLYPCIEKFLTNKFPI